MTCGAPIRVIARSRRRRIPPEYVIGHPVSGIGQLEPLEQLVNALSRRLGAREVVQVGHQREVLSTGQQLVDGRELSGHTDRVADCVGLARNVVSGDPDLPWSASSSVARIRTIVVLPAPLGPNSANTLPRSTANSSPSRTTLSPKDLRTSTAVMAGEDGSVMAFFPIGFLV